MAWRAFALVLTLALSGCATPSVTTTPAPSSASSDRPSRVVIVGLDNYHLDDVKAKMPSLYAFLRKGALSAASHHPDVPPKTAPGFASIASGQYPDRHGALNNSFIANGSRPGFGYWENVRKLTPPTFLSEPPWVAFNKAGYDVGAIGWQGLVLESKEEASALLGHAVDSAEIDQRWGLAVHRKDGTAELGTAQIAALRERFPKGWENGWSAPLKSASVTLPMARALIAAGVPIVFTYVENTHSRCAGTACTGNLAAGSFDDLLAADDAAFGAFFADLEKSGVTPANTLFIVTTDEGDHYVAGGAKAIDVSDLQPAIYGGPGVFYGPNADTIGATLAAKGGAGAILTRDAMKAVHAASGADGRTPTLLALPDGDSTYARGGCSPCPRWNHGNYHPDTTNIWLGIVGPGIKFGDLTAYTDHPDIVATLRAVLGIPAGDDIDGVPITPAFAAAVPAEMLQLREAFKALEAPWGSFGVAVMKVSTHGVTGGGSARADADRRIADLAARRAPISSEMRAVLSGAAKRSPDEIAALIRKAQALIAEAER